MDVLWIFYVLIVLVSVVNSNAAIDLRKLRPTSSTSTTTTTTTTTTTSTTTTTTTTTQKPIVNQLKPCYFNQKVCVKKWDCATNQNTTKYMINLISNDNCNYLEVCCESSKHKKKRFSDLQNVSGCGYANPSGIYLSLEGNVHSVANFGAYPWTIAIFNRDADMDFLCAGSLIHNKMVLTTNSCTGPKGSQLIARAGEWDLRTDQEILPHQDVAVIRTIYHEKFREFPEQYDIALLILENAFNLRLHIQLVCLPTSTTELSESDCLATGWEKLSNSHQLILQTNRMNVSDECTNDPNSNLFCAVSQQNGLRYAEGSSLVCPWVNSANRYSIKGLWSSGSGKVNNPTYFINVINFVPWILQNANNTGIIIYLK